MPITAPPPIAHVGQPLAQPAASTLFSPGRFHTTVRIPRSGDTLYVVGGWGMNSLRVTVVGASSKRTFSAGSLPGARYGVQLPVDAASARAVVIDGTAVNAYGGPVLRSASQLYAASVTNWPALALFGMLLGLACVAALIGIATRSAVLAWYAALLGAEAAASFDVLGAFRPPAMINQPLHSVMVGLVLATSLCFARAFFGRRIMPRRTVVAVTLVSMSTWLYVAGGDVWQDLWPSVPQPFDSVVYFAPDFALLVVAVLAVRAGRRDAYWYIFSQIATLLGFYAQELPFPLPADIVANAAGVVAMSCGVALALSRREDERRRLKTAASTDALTGLANRRAFDAAFETEWSRASRTQTPLALIMIDVDHFKRYNDCFGHPAGDEVLRSVAEALSTIPERGEDFAARYGGEEFAVILPGLTAEGAYEVGESVRQAIESLTSCGANGGVTASCGIAAVVPSPDVTIARLLELADAALYEAKRSGRNRVVTAHANEPLRAAVSS